MFSGGSLEEWTVDKVSKNPIFHRVDCSCKDSRTVFRPEKLSQKAQKRRHSTISGTKTCPIHISYCPQYRLTDILETCLRFHGRVSSFKPRYQVDCFDLLHVGPSKVFVLQPRWDTKTKLVRKKTSGLYERLYLIDETWSQDDQYLSTIYK